MLEDESLLIIERTNGLLVTHATSTQFATSAGFNGGKAHAQMKKYIKSLTTKTGPRSSGQDAIKWPPDDYEERGGNSNGWVPPEVEE